MKSAIVNGTVVFQGITYNYDMCSTEPIPIKAGVTMEQVIALRELCESGHLRRTRHAAQESNSVNFQFPGWPSSAPAY